MPAYEDDFEVDYLDASQTGSIAPTKQDNQFAAAYLQQLDRPAGASAAAMIGGSALDLVDTAFSSLIPGVERQDVNNTFLSAIGSPGLSGWFDQNRGNVEIGSGIAGIVVSDMIAKRILAPGSAAMKAIRGVPYVRGIAQVDKQYRAAQLVAQKAGLKVAKRGAMGADRFLGADMMVARLGAPGIAMSRKAADAAFTRAAIIKGGTRNLATEGVMAAILHTNSFLYDDDLAHNVAWDAAGMGLGAVVDLATSGHILRKMANSEAARNLNRKAYDVTGLENDRIQAFVNATRSGDSADAQFIASGGVTDAITSLAIQASENTVQRGIGVTARRLFGNREATATGFMATAQDYLGKVTARGIRGIKQSGFAMKDEGLGAPLKESLDREPTFMYGFEEVGTTPRDHGIIETHSQRDANLKARHTQVRELLNNGGRKKTIRDKTGKVIGEKLIPLSDEAKVALERESGELDFARSWIGKLSLEPGEWAPIEFGKILDGFEPAKILPETTGDGYSLWQRAKKTADEGTLGIDSNGELFLPAGRSIDKMTITDMIHLYKIGDDVAKHFADGDKMFMVPKNPNWFQLDLAARINKLSDGTRVAFPEGMTAETAAVESLAQKVDAIRAKNLDKEPNLFREVDEVEAFINQVFFNLPRISPHQAGRMGSNESVVDVLLHGIQDGDQVRNMTQRELLDSLNQVREITGLTDEAAPTLSETMGNSFKFMQDRDGNFLKPIIGYQRPMQPWEWSQDHLATRHIQKAMHLQEKLVGPEADEFTKMITDAIMSNPASSPARKVPELADDQNRSWVPGFRGKAPQDSMGAAINAITSRERRDVDSTIMRAASQVQEIKTRITQALTRQVFDKHMGGLITEINSTRNRKSHMLLNQLLSHRQGWELAQNPVKRKLEDGAEIYVFPLDKDSVLNQRRWKEAFGTELPTNAMLKSPQGVEVGLDGLAMKTFEAMQAVHEGTRAAKNTLLRAMGLPEIKRVPWYAPPAPLKDKYVAFTFDVTTNEQIPGLTVRANSPEKLAEGIRDLEKSPTYKENYITRQRQRVTDYMNLWDKAHMEWMAPNTTPVQPGKNAFGRTGGPEINNEAFAESLITMRDSLMSHGDDIIELMFDEPIKAARVRAKVARVETSLGRGKDVQHSSIYDRYLQNLTGRSSLGAKDSYLGDFTEWLEQRLNGFLGSVSSGRSAAYEAFQSWIMAAAPGKSPTGKLFDDFSKSLGQYMPYKSAQEMLESRFSEKTPLEVQQISAKLSWFEAASRLRWFESMHALVNLSSMISNMPAVVKALQPKLGETLEDAGLRNANLTMTLKFAGSDTEGVVLPNTAKLLWKSYSDHWSKDEGIQEFIREASKLGYMDQEVAEFERAWGAIDSKAGWRKVMFGDPDAKTKLGKAGIDGALGMLSDKSEAFTRSWGMLAGRRVAESMGIKSIPEQMSFAHELTNKLIANYDPRNRPEVFQGALGAPLGLFQSYVLNFYGRMFRYVETGDARSLLTQYATQSAMFGTGSMPGWDTLNWAFLDKGQAEVSPEDDTYDSLAKRMGTPLSEWVMNGSISNLPKLFGMEGASLYTRGDAEFRMPVVNLPVADTIGRVVEGFSAAAASFKNTGKITGQQTAEILANTLTNRPMAGWIELASGGSDTDSRGQLVSEARSATEQTYRALGIRSMSQQKEIEAFYANREAQAEQQARRSALNSATRAAVRAEQYSELPKLFVQYVKEGGDPSRYTRWVKSAFESANDTRGERLLEKALKDPNNQSNVIIQRMLESRADSMAPQDDDYGAEAAMNKVISDGWETTPDDTMATPYDFLSDEPEQPELPE